MTEVGRGNIDNVLQQAARLDVRRYVSRGNPIKVSCSGCYRAIIGYALQSVPRSDSLSDSALKFNYAIA